MRFNRYYLNVKYVFFFWVSFQSFKPALDFAQIQSSTTQYFDHMTWKCVINSRFPNMVTVRFL